MPRTKNSIHFCGIIIVLSEGIIMAISYNRLWKLLIDKKMKRTDLISGAGISTSALSKMGKDESVSLENIEKICKYLECNIEQVVEIS